MTFGEPVSSPRTEPAKRLSRRAALAGLAVLPVALPCAAAVGSDPIFVVIAYHRGLSAQYDAATSVSAKLSEGPEFDAADAVSGERSQALHGHAAVLIRSEPTTIAGVNALIHYVAGLRQWEVPADDGWHQVLLGTLATALDGILTKPADG
ncbi:hypothetical protein QA633_43705 [Bradyrhizobium barranii]|uniref:hypothetical protein n=1 Tax=Bradyrhizobium barranii TaxID=2992140 RepID=UPI0024AF3B85|nr:hypothetical protein [Bradyrhizobium barranii]WFT95080.1 hypothetical protein QA633_43705 [Bradyrhizobium barranii]